MFSKPNSSLGNSFLNSIYIFCHILTSICAAIWVDNNCCSSSESTESHSLESGLSKPNSLLHEEVLDKTDRTLSLFCLQPLWRLSSLPSMIAVRSSLLLLPAGVKSSSPYFAPPVLLIQLQRFDLLPLRRLLPDWTLSTYTPMYSIAIILKHRMPKLKRNLFSVYNCFFCNCIY